MKSSYSIVLYEQILQRKKFGVWYVKLEDLRELMGVEKYEYKEIADFEKRIVKPAVNEINKIINISLSYEKIKKGRNIVAYEFAWDFRNAKELYTNHNEKLKEESSKGLHSEEIQELLQIVPDLDITILESILNHFDFTKVKNAVLITAEKRKKIKLTI
ncbi:replication initiation protein [Caldisericum exile]